MHWHSVSVLIIIIIIIILFAQRIIWRAVFFPAQPVRVRAEPMCVIIKPINRGNGRYTNEALFWRSVQYTASVYSESR